MIDQRVAVLGLGKIGTILLRGLLKAGLSPSNACPTVRHADRTRALGGKLPLAVGTDNRAAARTADIILISVKPQNVDELVEEIRANVTRGSSSYPWPLRCRLPTTLRPAGAGSRLERNSDAMNPEARCRTDRQCLEGSESRDRLSGGAHAAGPFFWPAAGVETTLPGAGLGVRVAAVSLLFNGTTP